MSSANLDQAHFLADQQQKQRQKQRIQNLQTVQTQQPQTPSIPSKGIGDLGVDSPDSSLSNDEGEGEGDDSPGTSLKVDRDGKVKKLASGKRADQNRKAQRAFRQRKDKYIKDLELRSQELDIANSLILQLKEENDRLNEIAKGFDMRIQELEEQLGEPIMPDSSPAIMSPNLQRNSLSGYRETMSNEEYYDQQQQQHHHHQQEQEQHQHSRQMQHQTRNHPYGMAAPYRRGPANPQAGLGILPGTVPQMAQDMYMQVEDLAPRGLTVNIPPTIPQGSQLHSPMSAMHSPMALSYQTQIKRSPHSSPRIG